MLQVLPSAGFALNFVRRGIKRMDGIQIKIPAKK
jgi:hypothetical protein